MNTLTKKLRFSLLMLLTAFGSISFAQRAIFVEETVNSEEFRMENLRLPVWDIIQAGPGKDGIPALSQPAFVKVQKDGWMEPDEEIIGVYVNGVAKAYPVRILNYHEVVNDDFAGQTVAVTYSPLCDSGMAFNTENNDGDWELAVSGLLYNNNLLFFDRQTESLWSQVTGTAVSGPVEGAKLDQVATSRTTWGEWAEKHPETLLLSKETGHNRNYEVDAYAYYAATDRLMFPMNHSDKRLPVKERILGIEVDGAFKAYPYAVLASTEGLITEDLFNGQSIRISFNKDTQTAEVSDAEGNIYPSNTMYWFAWSAFHQETELHGILPEGVQTRLSMTLGML